MKKTFNLDDASSNETRSDRIWALTHDSRARSRADDAGESDLRFYLGVMRRRWLLVLIPAVLTTAFSAWTIRSLASQYEAEALLQQRQERPVAQDLLIRGQADFGSQLEIIRSRAVLLPAIDSLALQFRMGDRSGLRTRLFPVLYVGEEAPGGSYAIHMEGNELVLLDQRSETPIYRGGLDDPVEGPGYTFEVSDPQELLTPLQFSISSREAAVRRVRSRLEIEPGAGLDLIWVRYTDPDPQLAADVVNAIARSHQEHRAQVAREAARRRGDVIGDQLIELADSLSAAQELVLNYQRDAELLDPTVEGQTLLTERLRAEEELRDMRFQEAQLGGMLAQLRGGGDPEVLVQGILALGGDLVPTGAAMQARLENLKTERSRLTASSFGFTANVPAVQVVDSLIAAAGDQILLASEQSLEALTARIRSTQQRIGTLRAEVGAVPGRTAGLTRLQQRVIAVQSIYDNLVDGYYQAQIAAAVESGDIDVVDPATVPLSALPTRGSMKLAMALFAGLAIGCVAAGTFEHLDRSVGSAVEVERITQVQVIGTVPRIRIGSEPREEMVKEAFRALRTNLQFAGDYPPRTVAVASAVPSEGKSTVSANLALSLLEQGRKVLLIDSDVRRPTIEKVFRLPKGPGLTDVIVGDAELDEALQVSSKHSGLHILCAGSDMPDSAALLSTERFQELLSDLESRYDNIVIDTPALLPVTDGALVAASTDGTVFVVRAHHTDEAAVRSALSKLMRVNAKLLGIVLNDVRQEPSEYYGYYGRTAGGPASVDRPRTRRGRPLLEPVNGDASLPTRMPGRADSKGGSEVDDHSRPVAGS